MFLKKKNKAEIIFYIFLKFILNKILGREGDVLPAYILKKIDKNIFDSFAGHVSSLGIPVIFITGTNGKTTTSNIIAETLKLSGKQVCFNSNGADMANGIFGAIIGSYKLLPGFGMKKFLKLDFKFAADFVIIECDEKVFPYVSSMLKPDILIITNFYRDQLDRYGEINSTVFEIKKAVKRISAANERNILLVLPSFEPLAAFVGYEINEDKKYFGFDKTFAGSAVNAPTTLSDAAACPNCKNILLAGEEQIKSPFSYVFKCETCGFSSAVPEITATKNITGSLTIERQESEAGSFTFKPVLTGDYNAANYLAAYSVLKNLKIGDDIIKTSFENFKTKFGRSFKKTVKGLEINIDLVKNPAGTDSVLEKITESNFPVDILFAFSDRPADGRDVSWIWDIDFEKYARYIGNVVISGLRPFDMALRLKTAGIDPKKITVEYNLKKAVKVIIDIVEALDFHEKKIYILPTYTELLRLKKYINSIK